MARTFGGIAFTPLVKALQEQHGSRRQYERMVTQGPEHNRFTEFETTFLAERDSFYWATVNADGWPYIQHRGGPKGVLKVIDDHTLAFADYSGNKQYITTGNLQTNDRVAMFFMDYPRKARLKVLGHARAFEGDTAKEWMKRVTVEGETSPVERVFVIDVEAYDWNCPQHITPRWTRAELEPQLEPLLTELASLRAEVAHLKETH